MRAAALYQRIRVPRLRIPPHVIAFVLIIALVGAMAIEPTRQLVEQRERIAGMDHDLRRLERTNDRLEHQITRLKDPDFIEQRAREVGLVRPGEIPFVVMPPSKGAGDHKAEKGKPRSVPADEPSGFWDGLANFLGL